MKRVWRNTIVVAVLLVCGSAYGVYAQSAQNEATRNVQNEAGQTTQGETLPKRPNKATVFFYRVGEWIDHYVMKDLDTTYIGLPEHSWRLAYTNGMLGINSTFTSFNTYYDDFNWGDTFTRMRTTPSVNLGFHAGFRGLGFGYSWDAVHAYSQNMNFTFGNKRIGIEFMRQRSTNIRTFFSIADPKDAIELPEDVNDASITNTSLNVWYALNATHYSHNAAIKQSYIQKKTAGSLLVQVNYMSTDVLLGQGMSAATNGILGVETHQVGVGLGYGINYTPNHGKVLLHFSAMAQLVCFSHNLVTLQDSMLFKTEAKQDTMITVNALYRINSRYPVHVTGTMRAAVSWEINKWVHLSAWAQGNNMRFMAQAASANIKLSNWNWQVNLSVGVRFGAGYERRQRVLEAEEAYLLAEEKEILRLAHKHRQDSLLTAQAAEIQSIHAESDSIAAQQLKEAQAAVQQGAAQSAKQRRRMRHTKLPQWITDFFYSPRP